MSSTATDAAARLGIAAGQVVQELGWDNDVDDDLRVSIEDAIDGDMVDSDYGNVVDAVLMWWREDDGDLVDALVDALTDLADGGVIWLLTPKHGRRGDVEPADIVDACSTSGLRRTTSASLVQWQGLRLVSR